MLCCEPLEADETSQVSSGGVSAPELAVLDRGRLARDGCARISLEMRKRFKVRMSLTRVEHLL